MSSTPVPNSKQRPKQKQGPKQKQITQNAFDLPASVWQRLARTARARAPDEACALLLRPKVGQRRRWSMRTLANLSATPQTDFAVDAGLVAGLRTTHDVILFHSHPQGPAFPSYADMAAHLDTGLPFLIADLSSAKADFFWLGGPPEPLDGRPFRHGVTDCYGLIRDLYARDLNIGLMNWPREWMWWQQNKAYYEDLFAQTGFSRLTGGETPQPFDICLMRIRSETANHAAVLLDDGCLYHHPAGRWGYDPARLPRRDPAERWAAFIQCWLRHETLF